MYAAGPTPPLPHTKTSPPSLKKFELRPYNRPPQPSTKEKLFHFFFHPPGLRNREIVVAFFLLPLSPVPFALDIRQCSDPGKKDTLSFYFFFISAEVKMTNNLADFCLQERERDPFADLRRLHNAYICV